MKKIIEKIKGFAKWVASDGLQHIGAIDLIILTLTPIIGIWWASLVAIVIGIGREAVQFLRGKNTKEQVHHDLICDGIGLIMAYLTIAVWWLCNLN